MFMSMPFVLVNVYVIFEIIFTYLFIIDGACIISIDDCEFFHLSNGCLNVNSSPHLQKKRQWHHIVDTLLL